MSARLRQPARLTCETRRACWRWRPGNYPRRSRARDRSETWCHKRDQGRPARRRWSSKTGSPSRGSLARGRHDVSPRVSTRRGLPSRTAVGKQRCRHRSRMGAVRGCLGWALLSVSLTANPPIALLQVSLNGQPAMVEVRSPRCQSVTLGDDNAREGQRAKGGPEGRQPGAVHSLRTTFRACWTTNRMIDPETAQ